MPFDGNVIVDIAHVLADKRFSIVSNLVPVDTTYFISIDVSVTTVSTFGHMIASLVSSKSTSDAFN